MIRLIGAGVGRTGTHSLKLAIEHLLGTRCHHMMEVTPEQLPHWQAGYEGREVDWLSLLSGFGAIVDWPGAGLWRELAAAFPDAPVLLSTRASADEWYTSAAATILDAMQRQPPGEYLDMTEAMMARFAVDWRSGAAIKRAYLAHNDEVRSVIAPERLFHYQPGDGWAPLCAALGLSLPGEPFPHTNTTAEFRARVARARQERGG